MELKGSATTMDPHAEIFAREKEKEPEVGVDVCKYDKGK